MIWIYLGPAIVLAILATLFFLATFFGDEDEDGAMWTALAFVAAWIWPLIIPLAVLAVIVLMLTHILIMCRVVKEPEWWPTR